MYKSYLFNIVGEQIMGKQHFLLCHVGSHGNEMQFAYFLIEIDILQNNDSHESLSVSSVILLNLWHFDMTK